MKSYQQKTQMIANCKQLTANGRRAAMQTYCINLVRQYLQSHHYRFTEKHCETTSTSYFYVDNGFNTPLKIRVADHPAAYEKSDPEWKSRGYAICIRSDLPAFHSGKPGGAMKYVESCFKKASYGQQAYNFRKNMSNI